MTEINLNRAQTLTKLFRIYESKPIMFSDFFFVCFILNNQSYMITCLFKFA